MLPAFAALDHRGGHHVFDEAVPHIRQGGIAVQAGLRLHLDDAVLQQLPLILVQGQTVRQVIAALDELGGAEPGRNADAVGVIGDQVHHRVDAAVDGGVVGAEVRDLGQYPAPGRGQGLVHQLRHALALGGRNGHHRDAQLPAHPLHVHGAAVGPDLVHHVQGQHHGHPQLQQLQRQIEVALDVGGVHDVDDAVGLLVEDVVPGDDLLLGIGPQGVDARQVHHGAALFAPYFAGFLVHGDAGEVAHVLVGAGEGVEKRGFAAILIADQGENHTAASFTWIFMASSTRRVSS